VQPTRCRDEVPVLRETEGHLVACHYAEEIKAGKLRPHEVEEVFEPGPGVPAAYEPPPV
jgi:peptide/nickel transport system ATP-binding protein